MNAQRLQARVLSGYRVTQGVPFWLVPAPDAPPATLDLDALAASPQSPRPARSIVPRHPMSEHRSTPRRSVPLRAPPNFTSPGRRDSGSSAAQLAVHTATTRRVSLVVNPDGSEQRTLEVVTTKTRSFIRNATRSDGDDDDDDDGNGDKEIVVEAISADNQPPSATWLSDVLAQGVVAEVHSKPTPESAHAADADVQSSPDTWLGDMMRDMQASPARPQQRGASTVIERRCSESHQQSVTYSGNNGSTGIDWFANMMEQQQHKEAEACQQPYTSDTWLADMMAEHMVLKPSTVINMDSVLLAAKAAQEAAFTPPSPSILFSWNRASHRSFTIPMSVPPPFPPAPIYRRQSKQQPRIKARDGDREGDDAELPNRSYNSRPAEVKIRAKSTKSERRGRPSITPPDAPGASDYLRKKYDTPEKIRQWYLEFEMEQPSEEQRRQWQEQYEARKAQELKPRASKRKGAPDGDAQAPVRQRKKAKALVSRPAASALQRQQQQQHEDGSLLPPSQFTIHQSESYSQSATFSGNLAPALNLFGDADSDNDMGLPALPRTFSVI